MVSSPSEKICLRYFVLCGRGGGSSRYIYCMSDVDLLCWLCIYSNIFVIGRYKSLKVHFTLINFFGFETYRLLLASLVVARNCSLACAWCLNPGPEFKRHMAWSVFLFCELRREVIVLFILVEMTTVVLTLTV